MGDAGTLAVTVLWTLIGLGCVIYGRRRRANICLGCGVALIMIPYLLRSALNMSLAGAIVLAAIYIFEKRL